MSEQNQMLEAATCLSINIGNGLTAIAEAIRESAAATDRLAEAMIVLARATAGEFDEPEEVPDSPQKGQGMGMGGFTLVELLITIAITTILMAIVIAAMRPRPTIELQREKWACEKVDMVRGTRIQMVGKVWVPVPIKTEQCVQWRRLGRDDG